MDEQMARRQFLGKTGASAAAALGVISEGAGAAGSADKPGGIGQTSASPSNGTPLVEPTAMISGVLLADSFDSPHLDAALWSRPNWMTEHNPYIAVGPVNGRLEISGISRPTGTQHQYIGILSKYFRETDVVLATRLRVHSPFEKPGRIQHHVHLCTGDWPDFFTEIIFGKISTGPPRWYAAYLDRIWVYSGFNDYLEPTLPATGTEDTDWQTVLIEHDGITGRTQNYLILGKEWKPVGPSHILKFNHSHVELKVDVNAVEAPVHMEFDDVRLYPNPAHNPATIVVSSRVVGAGPEFPINNLRVRIQEESSGLLLGEATTDEGGQARVLLSRTVLYPVAAIIEVWDQHKLLLNSRIPQYQVQGLYPGDVWAVLIPPRA